MTECVTPWGGLRGHRPAFRELQSLLDLLGQAELFQRELDAGIARDRTELSRRHCLSRTRVTQILNLLRLHPAVLREVRRRLEAGDRSLMEFRLRPLLQLSQEDQLREAHAYLPGFRV